MLAVPRLMQAELFVELLLFQVWQQEHPPAMQRSAVIAVHDGGGQMTVDGLVVVEGHPDRPHVSVDPGRGLSDSLDPDPARGREPAERDSPSRPPPATLASGARRAANVAQGLVPVSRVAHGFSSENHSVP